MKNEYECAVITGASSGIGEALANRFASAGVKVALLARRTGRIESRAKSILDSGGQAIAIQCDVTDKNATQSAIEETRKQLGPIDLLIANAGIGQEITAEKIDLNKLELTYQVNVFGAIYSIAAVLPEMIERQRGHIVGISSHAAYRAYPKFMGYSGTKAALNRELEAMRNRLYKWNINVTTICAGFIRTEMTEKADIPQPMRLELEPATNRIYRAILKRKKFYSFPVIAAWYHRFANIIPPAVFDPLARRLDAME
jgi:short-subunit dehydrogenase